MIIFSKYLGNNAAFTAGANQLLSNLTSPTAVNQALNMAGATGSADLLWTGNNGMIGIGYSQTSGTDRRPGKAYIKDAIVVGMATPPYGTNNPLVTGAILIGNQVNVQIGIGANTFWNSVALGYVGFGKDGAGANTPAFINLDTVGDNNVYFSLLHRASARADYLKFGAGDLTFLQATGANLLWNTDGGGDIGTPDGGTTNKRPANIFASNYAQIGSATNFDGPSGSGYLEAGLGDAGNPGLSTFIGASGGVAEIGLIDTTNSSNVAFVMNNVGGAGNTQAGQVLLQAASDSKLYFDPLHGGMFSLNGYSNGGGGLLWLGLQDNIDYTGDNVGITIAHNGNNGVYANVLIAPHGSSPLGSALLEVRSTTQGFLPPRMTTTQKNAIVFPDEGLLVYDLTLHALCVYNGSAWKTVTAT
jgi:hypothetical protein